MLELILALLTLMTGSVWCLERFLLLPRRRRAAGDGETPAPNATIEFVGSFFPVILVVFLVRSFVVEPFRIPSGSMIPTLRVGDFILVNKFAYGLRCPVGNCKIVDIGEPQHGDVVVFKYPVDPSTDFIKRDIGLPGDQVHYDHKILSIDGKSAALDPAGLADDGFNSRLHEDFLGVKHDILVNPDATAGAPSCDFVSPNSDYFNFEVPAGHYLMMGDNRDGSYDSRCWGTVPEANLKGRAFLVWMSWDSTKFRPVLSRIGMRIH